MTTIAYRLNVSSVVVGLVGGIVGGLAACPAPGAAGDGPLLTGTTPNAVAVVACREGPRLLVTASGDARVDVIAPINGAATAMFLGAGSSPWDVAPIPTGDGSTLAVATMTGTHGLALLSPCGDDPTVLDIVTDDEPFALPVPITLRRADDVDGDGVSETTATRMRPRTPQAVAVANGAIYVVFANILAFSTGAGEPMLTGPGLLARYDVVGERLVQRDRLLLPCDNPGGIAIDVDVDASTTMAVFVTCAGRFVVDGGAHRQQSPGAIVRIQASEAALTVDDAAFFDDDSPGPVVLVGGRAVVGDLLDGAVRAIDTADLTIVDSTSVAGGIDSVFALAVVDGDVVAGWFDGRVQRAPFAGGAVRRINADGPIRGLVDIAVDGDSLYGLFTLSAELLPFTLTETGETR